MEAHNNAVVIVTADDFGLSPGVDRGILDAFRRGIVTSTALLVNFPDFSESLSRLREEPGLEVGIHLNLTAGPPVLSPKRVRTLIGKDSTFRNFSGFFAQVAASQIDWSEVASEWRAQFERGLDHGCRFTFITSHQHVHMLPEGARICVKLAHEFGVRSVRLTNFRLREMLWPPRPKAMALAPFVPMARAIFRSGGVPCNASTLEIPPGSPDTAWQGLRRTVQRLGAGVHELVCHPAYEDAQLAERDPYVAGRENELAVLQNPRLREFLESVGVRRAIFDELLGSLKRKDKAFGQLASLHKLPLN
jgi:chitin disaccharide deacetylase